MTSHLFSPLQLGPLKLLNRIIISPMCQYSAVNGCATDWHRLHWGTYSLSGAGLMMVEATAVSPEGRITPGCLGLWDDNTASSMKKALDFARQFSPIPFGIQLGHAGRKASTMKPWNSGHAAIGEGGWQVVGPSSIAFDKEWQIPHALNENEIQSVIEDFGLAAKRASDLGFDTIEIHAAHGYLLSSFLSPLANNRNDRWGGSLENRMRLPIAVYNAVRKSCPSHVAVGLRLNGTDWALNGITIEEMVVFSRALYELGCDYIDVSSGGNVKTHIPVGPGYQVEFAQKIRSQVGIPVIAVGMIRSPLHAEALIASGQADAIALGRIALNQPHWPWNAAEELGVRLEVAPQYQMGATSQYVPTFGR